MEPPRVGANVQPTAEDSFNCLLAPGSPGYMVSISESGRIWFFTVV